MGKLGYEDLDWKDVRCLTMTDIKKGFLYTEWMCRILFRIKGVNEDEFNPKTGVEGSVVAYGDSKEEAQASARHLLVKKISKIKKEKLKAYERANGPKEPIIERERYDFSDID